MKTLKILYIEDDSENRSDLIEALSGQVINGQTIEVFTTDYYSIFYR